MKPLLACLSLLIACLLICGCGSAEDKKPADKPAPKTSATTTDKAVPSNSATEKSAPSKSAEQRLAAPAPATANDPAVAETKKPPAEDDPFPDGEPK